MDCVHYWEVGPWGGGAPTGLIAPGATHPRYATAKPVAPRRRRRKCYHAAAEECLSARRRRCFVRRAAEALPSCALFDFVFYVHCSSTADLSPQVVILSFYLSPVIDLHAVIVARQTPSLEAFELFI
jgi:hypothetical protein